MARGIIYIMTTAVPGLIKIGKTGKENYKSRMYNLEHNGYRNVTALQRAFAIEVDNYDEKENMLHTIFEKSQVADTELFALDVNIAIQLLSSFDGDIIYPEAKKEDVFISVSEIVSDGQIPDGTYYLKRKKKSDNRLVSAVANIKNGYWTLVKGSVLGLTEDTGVSAKAKELRGQLPIDDNGVLLEDFELGMCFPSLAGAIVMNQSNNGWIDWKNDKSESINIYRKNNKENDNI